VILQPTEHGCGAAQRRHSAEEGQRGRRLRGVSEQARRARLRCPGLPAQRSALHIHRMLAALHSAYLLHALPSASL